eukprot:SAG11_NODE_1272_length_5334_cov_11.636676_5_plen_48_part_00
MAPRKSTEILKNTDYMETHPYYGLIGARMAFFNNKKDSYLDLKSTVP